MLGLIVGTYLCYLPDCAFEVLLLTFVGFRVVADLRAFVLVYCLVGLLCMVYTPILSFS